MNNSNSCLRLGPMIPSYIRFTCFSDVILGVSRVHLALGGRVRSAHFDRCNLKNPYIWGYSVSCAYSEHVIIVALRVGYVVYFEDIVRLHREDKASLLLALLWKTF